jgi:16S rRNA (guanine966-N2)-methyltransferase
MGQRRGSRNRVRIIGGEHRGRQIVFDDGPGLRPTGDRTRETLFNWLQAGVPGARCLDLFAGSGVLGFEAISRGAREVVMLDSSDLVIRRLKENSRLLGIDDRATVIRSDALEWLARAADRAFDIVFVDPPFAEGLVPRVLELLAQPGWLVSGSLVYVEQDLRQTDVPLPPDWSGIREKVAGQVRYRLLRFDGQADEGGEG